MSEKATGRPIILEAYLKIYKGLEKWFSRVLAALPMDPGSILRSRMVQTI